MKTNYLFKSLFFALTLIFTSCSSDSSDDSGGGGEQATSITVTRQSSSDVYVGDAIFFNVITDTGAVVSNSASLSVNSVGISGINYTPQTAGVLSVVATYNGLTSEPLEVTVLELPTKFKRNVLIEDYTGTWCGWCPRVSYGIEQVDATTDQSVTVAIHRVTTDQSSGYYDPYTYEASALENMIGLSGYPTAMLNRTTTWTYPEPSNVSQIVDLADTDADVGLALTPTLDGTTISIDVKIKFGSLSVSNPKLVVYILEDDLFHDQTNYTSYYGGGATLSNFEHDNVLRASITDLLGSSIPSAEVFAENEYSQTITADVPSNVTNTSKMRVVAFVTNGGNNGVYNARSASFGDTQTIEEL
ncbi:Omp28-related outer membrane protein [Winogradskyella psychrotolerans]|uniref:Omp28-related outer membrane protein n=1 Tax=Winogradskyella psychrotolerans TaxID=1344585 RepID=UPI001C07E76E|nr:Omp28-related outer membrane protein [Winogradskyella psychrotolerans]MBU2927542.1 Omp28-related outer membrane protein [Winogradskyella psychrotolerans]